MGANIRAVLSARAHAQLAKLSKSDQQRLLGALSKLSEGDLGALSSFHPTRASNLWFLRAGQVRAIATRSGDRLTIISIHEAAALRRVVRSLPREIVETQEIRTIRAHGRTYLENPPRKLKKPRVNTAWRKTLNTLFGEKARDLLISYILKKGAESWWDMLKHFIS